MYKFIIIRKKILFNYIFILLFFLISFVFFYNILISNNPMAISSVFLSNNDKNKDFNGDGILDTLNIEQYNSSYIIKISTPTEFILTSKENGIELFDDYNSFDIKVFTLDISRDNIPEIILSGFKNNKPTTYIYKWNNGLFDQILCSNNNISGIINSNNSQSPFFLSTQSTKGDESTLGVILIGNTLKDISYSNPTIPSLGIIQTFIDIIQYPYELTETPDLFSSNIPSSELGLLWNLDKTTYNYNFQYSFFNDINWTTEGIPSSIFWTLSFEKVNVKDSSKHPEEVILYVKTDLTTTDQYRISSIRR